MSAYSTRSTLTSVVFMFLKLRPPIDHRVGHRIRHGLHRGLGHGVPHVLSTPLFCGDIKYDWSRNQNNLVPRAFVTLVQRTRQPLETGTRRPVCEKCADGNKMEAKVCNVSWPKYSLQLVV